eukprot:GFUD01001923.1.p1 GENE.GFUD01001923.1~~GFUD01001923.1.p1  ORF type:complete len:593 (-),score=152.61 GFUD01001923.1:26-1804(-)
MASSSTSSDSRVMYTVVDKISGQKVGVLVCEGHEVPDLGQMKLKICPDGSVEQKWPVVGDPFIRKELDINGNKSVSSKSETFKKLVGKLVSGLVDVLDEETQWSCLKKTALKSDIESLLLEDMEGLKLKSQEHLRIQRLMKPFQFGWLRRVTIRSSDQRVTNMGYMSPPDSEGRRKRFANKVEIEKYLKETQMDNLELDNFCLTRNVLGLSSEFENLLLEDKEGLKLKSQEHLRIQRLMKPFQFGWLRRVTIRSSDQHVTSMSYMSPPDSEGRRKRFSIKIDIEKYLKETQMDKNLELSNFCVTRNVLGLSSEFESVQYVGVHRLPAAENNKVAIQEIVEGNASKCDKDEESFQIKRDNVVATNLDLDSSCDTVVGDSSSSGTMSSADSSTDDNADSDRSLNDFEDIIFPLTDFDSASRYKINSNALNIPSPVGSPQVVSPPSSPFLTINNADIPTLTAEPRDVEPLPLPTTASLFPPSDVTSSPSNLTSAASFYTSAASSFPPAPCQAAIPSTRVMLVMVSTESGDGERSRKQATLMIKSGVKVEKAMKKFGKMFGLDFRKLIFMSDTKQLTGEELAGGLEGALIRVEGMN